MPEYIWQGETDRKMESQVTKIVPVVLCGGSGTRLWPRSRAAKPKPFIPLLGDETLYQATLKRCSDRDRFAPPMVVIGEKHLEFAKPQAAQIAPDAQFVVEPMGRNTAPAIALAALALDENDVMLVCPSDHHIVDTQAFQDAAQAAGKLASDDWLVAFGIAATAPETGYGYIRRGDPLGEGHQVHSFVEKPDLETALGFLAQGGYAWNGGIFAFRAGFSLRTDQIPPRHGQAARAAFDSAIRRAKTFVRRPRNSARLRPNRSTMH